MPERFPTQPSSIGRSGAFSTTYWTVILAAKEAGSPESSPALEQLCRTYWPPLYAFARRRGHSPEDARDLTQQFFARLLEKDYLRSVEPAKGKFRTFLLTAMEHFLANEWTRARRQKRGGGLTPLSLDDQAAERAYQSGLVDELTAERILDRRPKAPSRSPCTGSAAVTANCSARKSPSPCPDRKRWTRKSGTCARRSGIDGA
jgi:hypothetical protein